MQHPRHRRQEKGGAFGASQIRLQITTGREAPRLLRVATRALAHFRSLLLLHRGKVAHDVLVQLALVAGLPERVETVVHDLWESIEEVSSET